MKTYVNCLINLLCFLTSLRFPHSNLVKLLWVIQIYGRLIACVCDSSLWPFLCCCRCILLAAPIVLFRQRTCTLRRQQSWTLSWGGRIRGRKICTFLGHSELPSQAFQWRPSDCGEREPCGIQAQRNRLSEAHPRSTRDEKFGQDCGESSSRCKRAFRGGNLLSKSQALAVLTQGVNLKLVVTLPFFRRFAPVLCSDLTKFGVFLRQT